jgi:hypothetical protein
MYAQDETKMERDAILAAIDSAITTPVMKTDALSAILKTGGYVHVGEYEDGVQYWHNVNISSRRPSPVDVEDSMDGYEMALDVRAWFRQLGFYGMTWEDRGDSLSQLSMIALPADYTSDLAKLFINAGFRIDTCALEYISDYRHQNDQQAALGVQFAHGIKKHQLGLWVIRDYVFVRYFHFILED